MRFDYRRILLFWILGILLLWGINCGDADVDSGGKEGPAGQGGQGAGQEDDLEAGYILQEDFSRNRFRITYTSATSNFIMLESEGAKKPFKDQGIEAVLELSPTGKNRNGQTDLRLETKYIILSSGAVKVDSREPLPSKEYVKDAERYDLQKALQMATGMKLTLSIDEHNQVVKISGNDLADKISSESAGLRAFISSFSPIFEGQIAQSTVMAAADYLPSEEVKVGSEWNRFIVNEKSGIGTLPLWVDSRFEEITTLEGQKQGHISFFFSHAGGDEIDTEVMGVPAKIAKMNLEGAGNMVFDLAENFAREFSLHMKGDFDMVWGDKAKGRFLMDEKVRLIKEIIREGQSR